MSKDQNTGLLNVNLNFLIYPGLFIILLLPPLLRGLYFAPDLLPGQIAVAVVFLLVISNRVIQRETEFSPGIPDYLALALVALYGITYLTAVSPGDAANEFFKYLMYFLAYLAVSRSFNGPVQASVVMHAVFFSCLAAAAIGITSITGIWKYPGAFVAGRINSTLQYPNALAIFLSLGVFLASTFAVRNRHALLKGLYLAAGLMFYVVIIGSQSRGAWFVLPVAAALFVFGQAAEKRVQAVLYLLLPGMFSLPVFSYFFRFVSNGLTKKALITLAGGVLVVFLATLALEKVRERLTRQNFTPVTRRILQFALVFYAIFVLVFYVYYSVQAGPEQMAKLVPVTASQRIHATDNSMAERFKFDKAALEIALHNPVLGTGGGGWNALYHQYMDYLTWSTEVHNNFFKVLVETGFPGFIVLLAFWFYMGRAVVRLWRETEDEGDWTLYWGAAACVLALGMHSFIDFDLSLPALSIILWGFFGIIRGAEIQAMEGDKKLSSERRKLIIVLVAGIALVLLLAVPSWAFYRAGVAGAIGAKAMNKINYPKAEKYYRKAIRLNPFNPTFRADLAQLYTLQGLYQKKDPAKFRQAREIMEDIGKDYKYNLEIRSRFVFTYMLQGEFPRAVAEGEAVLAMNPYFSAAYDGIAPAYIGAGKYYYLKGDRKKAREYWQKAYELPDKVVNLAKKLKIKDPYYLSITETPTTNLLLARGEASYFLGRYEEAIKVLAPLEESKPEAKIFAAAALYKKGDTKAAEAKLRETKDNKKYTAYRSIFEEIIKHKI